jgi:signal transduction histidine kinase
MTRLIGEEIVQGSDLSAVGGNGAVSERIADLETRLRRRERELSAIRRITNATLNARANLDELERLTLDIAIETVDATGGTIYVHDPKKEVLIFRYVVGASPEITRKLQGMEMPDTQGVAGEIFHSGKARITLDVTKDDKHSRSVDDKTSFVTKSMVTVPLISIGGTTIGVMQVLNRMEGVFDDEDVEVLEVLSAQAASALEAAKLYEEARRASVVNLIGDISHDVKNLLTPVVTGTQTLEMMVDQMWTDLDALKPEIPIDKHAALDWAVGGVRDFYKEAFEMVYDGARDAQERVREIADAIKGIIAEPHFEMSDFRERVESVAKVLKLVAERAGLTIELDGIQDVGEIELDRKSIYNAIYNLINNAIPEVPPGGRIMVRCKEADFEGKPGVEIQVADTGRGMPEHIRAKMFTKDVVSTKPGGTGLGTQIVKNVVDLHHGTIRVDSEAGVGTTFTINLPRMQPREHQPDEPAPVDAAG